MASNIKWIKITTDIFDDEKILLIESLPDSYAIITVWFKLLCLAGKQNNGGVFMLGQIAYTDKMLATIFRMKETTVAMALKTFEQFGMVEIIDGVITISNWSKHQTLDAYEKRKERDRLYQQERRVNRKALISQTSKKSSDEKAIESSDVVALDKDIDKDKEIDLETDKDKDINTNLKEDYINISSTDLHAHSTVSSTIEDERVRVQNRLREDFKRLWENYPRKEGHGEAWDEFKRLWPTTELVDEMVEAVKAQCQSTQWKIENGRFIPQLKTWLKGTRWKDVLSTDNTTTQSSGNVFLDALIAEGLYE